MALPHDIMNCAAGLLSVSQPGRNRERPVSRKLGNFLPRSGVTVHAGPLCVFAFYDQSPGLSRESTEDKPALRKARNPKPSADVAAGSTGR